VTATEIQFDDASNYATFDAPNIRVRGADAQAVISAFAAAGIDDCDPTRNLFIVCNTGGGAPGCGHEWMDLATVGASELLPVCGPGGGTQAEPPFDAATSLTIWNAIVKVAADAGFQPMNGTMAQTTVINADYFTWDGTTWPSRSWPTMRPRRPRSQAPPTVAERADDAQAESLDIAG
jgi:hypothetical protein